MSLSDVEARNAKPRDKDYKLRDRDNMYLTITKKGTKYWRMDYRHDGKRKTLTFGKFPELKLREARKKCSEAKDRLAEGGDPSQKNHHPVQQRLFRDTGMEWYRVKLHDKSDSHKSRSLRLLEKELFPKIGDRTLSDITPSELLEVLRAIEDRGVIDTARRAKQTAGQVFTYAISCDYTDNNPTVSLSGALKPKNTTHYPSITDPKGVGRLMLAIDTYTGSAVVRTALKLSPLFFLRPGELRQLEWADVNFEDNQILIPAERMKMKMDHIVPLAHQAKHLMQQLHKITGSGCYVFPSQRGPSRPLSDNGVRIALRTIGYSKDVIVPHGFRAMARTLLDEELEFSIVWIEQQLAHVVKDANGRAYNRTKHLKQRREMMQKWADYLEELKGRAAGQNVIHIA